MKKIFIPAVLAVFMTACSDEPETFIMPEEGPTTLSWDSVVINVDDDSDWCLSRSNSWVAFTDYDNKSQYMLQWEGGMDNGEKHDAVLKVALNGGAPQENSITTFTLTQDGVNCIISFTTTDGKSGMFNFPL